MTSGAISQLDRRIARKYFIAAKRGQSVPAADK